MAFRLFLGGDLQLLGAKLGRENEAAHLQIVGVAIAAVEMGDEAVGERHVDGGADAALVCRRAVGGDALDMDRLVRHAAGYAPVHDVDRAADRLAAEPKPTSERRRDGYNRGRTGKTLGAPKTQK